MGDVKLNSSGGGSVTLTTPSTASNLTVTLPSASGTMSTTAGTETLTNKTLTAAGSNTVEATSGPTSTQLAGNRNKIINGAMQVWQRGTTFTAGGYGPDRWLLQVAGTTTFTQESSDVPAGAQYAVKWTTGAASSYGQIRQFLEQLNVIPLRGLAVTASAMVKLSSGFSGTLTFEIYYNATSDSASAGGWTACSYSVVGTPTSSAYTKITATFTVPSNAVGLYIGVVPTAAQPSGQYALQSLIQLEPGATATPFENRLYGTELALCQRYGYLKPYISCMNSQYATFNSVPIPMPHPVTMRSSPTLLNATSWTIQGVTGAATNVSVNADVNAYTIAWTGTNGVPNQNFGCYVINSNQSNTFLSAEL